MKESILSKLIKLGTDNPWNTLSSFLSVFLYTRNPSCFIGCHFLEIIIGVRSAHDNNCRAHCVAYLITGIMQAVYFRCRVE